MEEKSILIVGLITAFVCCRTEAQSVCTLSNHDFVACRNSLFNVFRGQTTQTGVFQAMCSDSGRKAMLCYMEYVKQCPELSQQAGIASLNLTSMQAEGSLDVVCELLIGECQILKRCFKQIPQLSHLEYATKMRQVMEKEKTALYKVLPYLLATMCGPLEEYIFCFMDSMNSCPKISSLLEKKMMDGFVKALAIPSFKQLAEYMKGSCSLEKDFRSRMTCVVDSLDTHGFSSCIKVARQGTSGTCSSQEAVSTCASTWVGSRCGHDAGRFLASGFRLIYKDIPFDCDLAYNSTDQSIKSGSGNSETDSHFNSASQGKLSILTVLGVGLTYFLSVRMV